MGRVVSTTLTNVAVDIGLFYPPRSKFAKTSQKTAKPVKARRSHGEYWNVQVCPRRVICHTTSLVFLWKERGLFRAVDMLNACSSKVTTGKSGLSGFFKIQQLTENDEFHYLVKLYYLQSNTVLIFFNAPSYSSCSATL